MSFIIKDTRIRFNIWELTGNEEMRKAFLSSICNINLAIIFYSIENKKSFEYIYTLYKEIKKSGKLFTRYFISRE